MSYKQKASANRDALFGSSTKSSSKKKRNAPAGKKGSGESLAAPAGSGRPASSTGYNYDGNRKKKNPVVTTLSGEAKTLKLKEAEEYRDKAKKSMQKGLFSKPDPLAASTFYKRAADAYQLCGEYRLERLYRINSADCQMRVGAWATAASEYTRAAELLETADDETVEMKKEVGRKLHLNASEAWRNMNEPAKAASSQVQAALVLMCGDDSGLLSPIVLQGIEEATEAHVPDVLNPYGRYRQTGVSAYVNADLGETVEDPSSESLELARQNIVSRPYAHESVQDIIYLFVTYGEYASALYAAGAVTTLLSRDGVSTLSLSRAFLAETILTLAMGDPIAAEQNFLGRHVQKSSYLTSRECKLAEELFRAIKVRDGEALEEARSRQGSNRAAIGNLPESLQELVGMLRLNGVARKGSVDEAKPKSSGKKPSKSKRSEEKGAPEPPTKTGEGSSLDEIAGWKTGYEQEADEAETIDAEALQNELDALDFGDSGSEMSDDSVDLR